MEILTFAAYIVLIPKLIVKLTSISKNKYINTQLLSMVWGGLFGAAGYFIFPQTEYILPVLIISGVVQGMFVSDIYDNGKESVDVKDFTIDNAFFDNNK